MGWVVSFTGTHCKTKATPRQEVCFVNPRGVSHAAAGLNRITDIALFVADLERAIAFYRDRLDLELKQLDSVFAEFQMEFQMEGTILALWEEADIRHALHFDDTPRCGPHAMVAIRMDTAAYFSDPDDNLWEIYSWVGPPRTA
jgi:uncharacterized protein